MDPIFDRLGRLIRSFGVDSREQTPASSGSDSFQQEAEEELEEFLRTGRNTPNKPSGQGNRTFQQQHQRPDHHEVPPKSVNPTVVQAFSVLGISPEGSWEEINSAHRALLKKHHPDSHAGNEANVKKATAQSQKINEAYQVLKKYFGR